MANPNPIILSPPATEQTVQAMTSGTDAAVTTSGSVFDTALVTVEDNMQVTAAKAPPNTTFFTIAADGTYTHNASVSTVVGLKYYSPSTTKLSYVELTIDAAPAGPVQGSRQMGLAANNQQTIQAMTTGANAAVRSTGSVFDDAFFAVGEGVENNMQVTAPRTTTGTNNFILAADGTYTHDSATTIVIPLKFYSPATGQLSYAELTLEAADPVPEEPPTFSQPSNEVLSLQEGNTIVGNTINSATGVPTPQYRLDDTQDQADFEIDISTGALTFKVAPDYDIVEQRSYSPVITAYNTVGSATRTIDITITEVPNINIGIQVTCRDSSGDLIADGEVVWVVVHDDFGELDTGTSMYSNPIASVSGDNGLLEVNSQALGYVGNPVVVSATYQGDLAIYETTVIDLG